MKLKIDVIFPNCSPRSELGRISALMEKLVVEGWSYYRQNFESSESPKQEAILLEKALARGGSILAPSIAEFVEYLEVIHEMYAKEYPTTVLLFSLSFPSHDQQISFNSIWISNEAKGDKQDRL